MLLASATSGRAARLPPSLVVLDFGNGPQTSFWPFWPISVMAPKATAKSDLPSGRFVREADGIPTGTKLPHYCAPFRSRDRDSVRVSLGRCLCGTVDFL